MYYSKHGPNYCGICDKLFNKEDKERNTKGICKYCIADKANKDIENPIAYSCGYHSTKEKCIWKKGTKSYKAYWRGVQQDSNEFRD